MPLSRTRDYLSIGELLDSVRDDFPDVTISKIRFLESEGLLTPERTSSGYRKFFAADVDRLRYILSLQRDHFLPLKVIRERLAEGAPAPNGAAAPSQRPPVAPASPAEPASAAAVLAGAHLSRDELLSATGLTAAQLSGLEEYGVLPRRGDRTEYDEHDLVIAKAAARFFEFGVEPRHLKMYRQAAEREAGFLEQIIAPALHRRDPAAQRQAAATLGELERLSRTLHDAALKTSLSAAT